MKIDKKYNQKELEMEKTRKMTITHLIDIKLEDAKAILNKQDINFEINGNGYIIRTQFQPSC